MNSLMRLSGLAFLVFLMAVVGCGGGDSGESRPGNQGGVAEQPLAGKGVTRAADLVGVWMRVTEGELLGLEFLKNDQVILTMRRGLQPSSMTMSYTLLDGGRLSVVSGGGATTVYRTTRSKDLLELVPESAGPEAKPQRFRKLDARQTLADGLRAQAAALEAERLERARSVAEFLRSDGLIVAPVAASDEKWLMSMRIDRGIPEEGGFEGMVVLDPSTERADALRPVTVHQFRGSLAPADELSSRLRMTIEIAPAHEPAGQGDVSGRVDLIVEGQAQRPSLSGTIRVAGRWPGSQEAVLTKNRNRYDKPIAKLEAQREAMRAALAEVTNAIGGRAVLRGERTSAGGGTPDPVELTIERGSAELTYNATLTVGTRRQQAAQGAVGLVIGRGALYINTPWGEQWRLHVESNGTLAGLWRPSSRHDFLGHGSISLTVERRLTIEELEAERAAIAKFLSEDLRTTRRFVGAVEVVHGDDQELWPVTAELRVSADGSAEGEVWSMPHRGGARMTGTLRAGTLTLKAAGYIDGSRQNRSLLQQTLSLRLTGVDPLPTLEGELRIGSRGGTAVLTLADQEPGTSESTALLEALRGRAFRVTNMNISRRPEPAYILLDKNPDGAELTGTIVGYDISGRNPSRLPPGLVRISALQERGHALLKIIIDSSPEPVRGYEGERYEYTATVRHGESGATVFAWDAPAMGDTTWLRLDPVESGQTPAISDEQRIRLAAQRMGAVVKPPASPAVGDTVLMIIKPTERDRRLGQIWHADGRYCAGNSIPAAALHAGVLGVDEIGVIRLTYHEPFTEPTTPTEQNGVTSQKRAFKAGNTVPTFSVERVSTGE